MIDRFTHTVGKWLVTGFTVQLILAIFIMLVLRTARNHLLSVPITVQAHSTNGISDYRLPIELSGRLRPSNHDILEHNLVPHLFDERGQTWPLFWSFSRQGTKNLIVTFPLSLRPEQQKNFFLEWLPSSHVDTPPQEEDSFHEAAGSNGENILSWKLEQVGTDRNIVPFEGKKMLRLTIRPAPEEGDHYTNYAIPLHPVAAQSIDQSTQLSYALYYPHDSAMRVTIQARIGNKTTEMNPSRDHNNVACSWDTSLHDYTVGQWYHRVVPLSTFAGDTLSELFVFANDAPSLTGKELNKDHVVYIDGIHLWSGIVPAISISNPVREFFRAAVMTPFFLIFLCSLFFWSLWLGRYPGEDVP